MVVDNPPCETGKDVYVGGGCSAILPDFEFTECGPELPGLALKNPALIPEISGVQVVHSGLNRRQRRKKNKTFRAGMFRGNNFTPPKKKRK